MRVSTSMQFNLASNTVARRQVELLRAQERIATGRAVNSFSEDPVAARKILREEATLRTVGTQRRIAEEAELNLSATDATLADVEVAVQRLYEMSVQYANDTYNAEDRARGADEVAQIRDRLAELANAERNGRFLFAGEGNRNNPFDPDGTFNGDTGRLRVQVGRGAQVDATIAGGEPFLDPTGGTETIFQVANDLETALRTNNQAEITNAIDRTEALVDRTGASRQLIGHRFERIDNVKQALDRAEVAAATTLKSEKDTDFSEAVLELQESEAGMRSALLITARLNELSLTNFL